VFFYSSGAPAGIKTAQDVPTFDFQSSFFPIKMIQEEAMQALLEQIKRKNSIIIVSGAGMSASAGFPTFVDAKTKRYHTKNKNDFDADVSNPIKLAKIAASFMDLKNAAKGNSIN
jgi:hypothetical protein